MTECQGSVANESLDVIGEGEQSERVCNGRTILADGLGDLLVRQAEFVDQLPITFSLFYRIEVLALKVLDERQTQQLFVGNVPNDGWYRRPSESARRTKTPLAGDEFEAPVFPRSNGNWLKETACLQAQL